MILELDISLLKQYNLTIDQLVFISLLSNGNQKNNQDIRELLSRVNEEEIKDLIARNIVIEIYNNNGIEFALSDSFRESVRKELNDMFDEFYEAFPVYVIRPDGTKGFLRSNVNKCRKEYNRIVGRSRDMHRHIMDCLQYELDDKAVHGKLGYMKTMWKWLTQREWECYEEQLQYKSTEREDDYGSSIL